MSPTVGGVWASVLVAMTAAASRTSGQLALATGRGSAGGLGSSLGHAVTWGFGRAVGSELAHAIGLPAGLALVAIVVAGSWLRRRRPVPARGRRRR